MRSILVVEDDAKIRANLQFQLRDEGHAVEAVDSAEKALEVIRGEGRPDLVLLDVRLPGMSGIDLVRKLGALLPPAIIISGEASISETVEALRLGVHDFIEKPFTRERLIQSIRNTLEHTALKRELSELRCELGEGWEILGRSDAVESLRDMVSRAAPTDARILIRGESGTGKELVANALHRAGPRSAQPFIKINCAAIAPQLVEDELFGHARGAFTDARAHKPGLFEEAHQGTLFLDEIGDMELGLQTRLLRVLEDGRVRRIGETREREVDVRVLAATHCDLERAVSEGGFREDLYFRLAHLPIDVPPLRERGQDVRLLFQHFVEHFSRRHRMRSRQVEDDLFPVLERYAWPGNVRELRSLAERLVVFGPNPLTSESLPPEYQEERSGSVVGRLLKLDEHSPTLSLKELKHCCEKEYIELVLEKTGWNVAAAARLLEIQRTHLHQKLAALGTRRPGRS